MNMFKPTKAKTPKEYIEMIEEPRRGEIEALHALIQKTAPKLKPHIQSGMIGYGSYHYVYASGKEGDWPVIALASQKNYISLYVMASDGKQYLAEKYKKKLPKANIGRSCVRFKKLEDVDLTILTALIKKGAAFKGPQDLM